MEVIARRSNMGIILKLFLAVILLVVLSIIDERWEIKIASIVIAILLFIWFLVLVVKPDILIYHENDELVLYNKERISLYQIKNVTCTKARSRGFSYSYGTVNIETEGRVFRIRNVKDVVFVTETILSLMSENKK